MRGATIGDVTTFERGDIRLCYDEYGSGFPLLLIAPGGMRSEVSFWERTEWNPIEQLSPTYRVIAMDQRNAGRSTGPISGSDGWHTYTLDQLALLDHLGVDRFHVAGMCIGGPYIMGLIEAAPERVASAVFFQTIGLTDNRDAFYDMYDDWANELRPQRRDVTDTDWAGLREAMYGGDDFMFNVSRGFRLVVRDAAAGPARQRRVSPGGNVSADREACTQRHPHRGVERRRRQGSGQGGCRRLLLRAHA